MIYAQFTEEMQQKLHDYMELVLDANKVMNLTAITEENEFFDKHFYDSILPVEDIDFNNKNILDIGSGAGFPGIPLAILFPNSKFTLLDPMNKRCAFLNKVADTLNLKNVFVICKRAEDITKTERESYDLVLSRAVANLSILLEICIPYLKVGGYFISYKGFKYNEEIKLADNALEQLNSIVASVQKRKLPLTKEERFNIIILKEKQTKSKFPRNFSQIKKRPL